MTELSLNILDIAYNSISANASLIEILVKACTEQDLLTISIKDNGKGMSEDFVKKVEDPFSTTRTTRKVGMGIPLFKQIALMSGGTFSIKSKIGIGTETIATFVISHIDRLPLGNLAETMITLIGGAKNVDFILKYMVDERVYVFDTREIKDVLQDVDIQSMEILAYLKDMINENIDNINGGIVL